MAMLLCICIILDDNDEQILLVHAQSEMSTPSYVCVYTLEVESRGHYDQACVSALISDLCNAPDICSCCLELSCFTMSTPL